MGSVFPLCYGSQVSLVNIVPDQLCRVPSLRRQALVTDCISMLICKKCSCCLHINIIYIIYIIIYIAYIIIYPALHFFCIVLGL